MTWLGRNVDLVLGLLAEHVWLALVPVVVGLLLALPLGWAATRVPRVRFALLSAAGLLYTVPSLALFVSYGMATMDSRGRVADRAVLNVLGWTSSMTRSIDTTDRALTLRPTGDGPLQMTEPPRVR